MTVSITALAVSVACLAFAVYMLMRVAKMHSDRIRELEHFIYPEWQEERKALLRKAHDQTRLHVPSGPTQPMS